MYCVCEVRGTFCAGHVPDKIGIVTNLDLFVTIFDISLKFRYESWFSSYSQKKVLANVPRTSREVCGTVLKNQFFLKLF